MTDHTVGRLEEIPERAFLIVNVDGVEVGVMRVGTELVAFENRCPHQVGPVCLGVVLGHREPILDSENRLLGERYSQEHFDVVCPWHGFSFDSVTGENICDPRMRLRRWDVSVRNGQVFINKAWR